MEGAWSHDMEAGREQDVVPRLHACQHQWLKCASPPMAEARVMV